MSEYWISPPHFGTMGKSTTVVHAPRNVDLPAHVVLQETETVGKQRKRKCLCLSVWLVGLILLTAGAIVVAHYLIPESMYNQKSENSFMQLQTCPDMLPLEDKVKNSEYIAVGSVLPDLALDVSKMIKGEFMVNAKLHETGKDCFQQSASRQVFFLSPSERQGRVLDEEDKRQHYYMPKYQSLMASTKIVDIVEKLVLDNLVTPQPVVEQTSTEGKPIFQQVTSAQ